MRKKVKKKLEETIAPPSPAMTDPVTESVVNIGEAMLEKSDAPSSTPEEVQQMESQIHEQQSQTKNVAEEVDRIAADATAIPESSPFGETATIDEIFNPEIHCTDASGNPIKTKAGKFRRKRGKSGAKNSGSDYSRFHEPANPSTLQFIGMMMDNVTLVAAKTFGEEWKLQIDERTQLCDVYARYAHYKGWDDAATPETIVIGVTVMVILPRLMTPKFQGWIASLFGGKKNAHVDSGTNTVRKDNAGEKSSNPNGNQKTSVGFGPNTGQDSAAMGSHIRIRSIG